MSTEEKKALMRRWFEFSSEEDTLTLYDTFASNFIQHDPAGDMPLEQFKQYNTILFAAFPDISFTVEDMIAEGDKVVTRWSLSATHKGEFQGIAPTGNRVSITGVDISRIVAGKVVESWMYSDRVGLLQQLGVIPSR